MTLDSCPFSRFTDPCEVYWSRMKSDREIDAWGLARAAQVPPLRANDFLESLVKEGRAVKTGNWYSPKEK